MTHERNVLMWVLGLESRIILAIAALVLLFSLFGCGGEGVTYATQGNERQMMAASFVMARCGELGVEVTVLFTDEEREVDGGLYGLPGEILISAAWALVNHGKIVFYNGRLDRWTDENLDNLAKHECCHLKMGYGDDPQNTEDIANQCVEERWGK